MGPVRGKELLRGMYMYVQYDVRRTVCIAHIRHIVKLLRGCLECGNPFCWSGGAETEAAPIIN